MFKVLIITTFWSQQGAACHSVVAEFLAGSEAVQAARIINEAPTVRVGAQVKAIPLFDTN